MITAWALVFITVNYLNGSVDVAVMNASKDPYLSKSQAQCLAKKEAIMAQTHEKNLYGFCVEVKR